MLPWVQSLFLVVLKTYIHWLNTGWWKSTVLKFDYFKKKYLFTAAFTVFAILLIILVRKQERKNVLKFILIPGCKFYLISIYFSDLTISLRLKNRLILTIKKSKASLPFTNDHSRSEYIFICKLCVLTNLNVCSLVVFFFLFFPPSLNFLIFLLFFPVQVNLLQLYSSCVFKFWLI